MDEIYSESVIREARRKFELKMQLPALAAYKDDEQLKAELYEDCLVECAFADNVRNSHRNGKEYNIE